MDARDFTCKEEGELVRCSEGYLAFVPAKLPPRIVYDQKLVLALSRADAALSELAGIGRSLPNPHFLITHYLRREAVLSSRIEGTQTNISDLLQDELEEGTSQRPRDDMEEVKNYIGALKFGIEMACTMPLNLRLVCQIHGRLMQGVRGENAAPGKFRTTQNWIGPRGCTGHEATFVPPPVERMQKALFDWELFLENSEEIPDLITCALAHQQFETIHPFSDGNGRIGRLLNTLCLMKRGRMTQPLLYLSAYFEANREAYYHLLQRVRTNSEWNEWLHFFLTGVVEIATQAVNHAGRLMDLREEYRSILHYRTLFSRACSEQAV